MSKITPVHPNDVISDSLDVSKKRRFSKFRGKDKSPRRQPEPAVGGDLSRLLFLRPEQRIASLTTLKDLSKGIGEQIPETVVVIGSGDLGRGLVSCLVRGGYRAVVASRNPMKAKQRVESVGGEIMEYSEALKESDIILLAIPFEGYKDLDSSHFEDKIIVDVSNRPPNYDRKGPSMAEILQKILPNGSVVKALNTLSAYALLRGLVQGSKQVPVCSDNEMAKTRIIEMVRKLGFTPVDSGLLSNAKQIEDIPLEFFPEWKTAALVAILIFLFVWGVVFMRNQLCPNFSRAPGEPWEWDLFNAFPLKSTGNSAAITSFNLLAACYFPGVLASYIQLYRGTKYSEFPSWLDNWMKARKQLGLFALLLSAVHVVFALCIKITYGMEVLWDVQGCMVFGGLSISLMGVLGITSLPSVSATLTWKEFFFVQSSLGWTSLLAAFVHTILAELDDILASDFHCTIIAHQVQIGLILPTLTIFMKIPLIFPCVDSYLVKIRRGYERNADKYNTDLSKVISLK